MPNTLLIGNLAAERLAAHPWSLGTPREFLDWEDVSATAHQAEAKLLDEQIARLQGHASGANAQYLNLAERRRRELRWFLHAFPVNQLLGVPNQEAGGVRVPFYLTNHVPLAGKADAERYIKLIESSAEHLSGLAERIADGSRTGVRLPRHAHTVTMDVLNCMVASGGGILAAFESRAPGKTGFDYDDLREHVGDGVTRYFLPGLTAIHDAITAMPLAAEGEDGVWALPEGDAFYHDMLSDWTADRVAAAELHAEAAENVRELQAEVAALGARLGYQGGFAEVIDALRADPRSYYDNDPNGREACMARARQLTDAIADVLPNWVSRIPHIPLHVVEVEPARAGSAILGDYSPPMGIGSPGRYLLNVSDMTKLPRHELAALTFHEGFPGHHLQIASVLENTTLADFERRPFLYEGFAEGWAMYSETLGFEMIGDMLDERDKLGLLLRKLWMAARLWADTGLNAMRWSRETVVNVLLQNTGVTRALAEAEADRYSVWPGQACVYHVGRTALQAMRDAAGPDGARAFHDRVVGGGAVPLWQLREEFS
jgi:uncharacterized protein (DUF885 family)